MKAEHRHELKTNELADFLGHFPQWCKDNLRMIIYVAIVVVLVSAAYIYKAYSKNVVQVNERARFTQLLGELSQMRINVLRQQGEGIDSAFNLLPVANKFQNFARNTKSPDMAALAYIKQGDALRTELHYRLGKTDEQTLNSQLEKARKAYENATAEAAGNPSLKALAAFGKGLCDEELGNFDAAKEIYKQIATDADLAGTVGAASAEHRLKVMDEYTDMVTFMPPKPVSLPSAMPDLTFPGLGGDMELTIPSVSPANMPGIK